MMRVRKVNKYLEIGSRFGGSLWRVAKSLPKPSFVASIDKPADKRGRMLLDECIGRIRRELGHQTQLYVGNSRKDRKSTRLNSSHSSISYAVFCLKKRIANSS